MSHNDTARKGTGEPLRLIAKLCHPLADPLQHISQLAPKISPKSPVISPISHISHRAFHLLLSLRSETPTDSSAALQRFPFSLVIPWALVIGLWSFSAGTVAAAPTQSSPPTFTRDLAPIIFQHCSPCHRPGQSAPFTLLNYADVKKHAKDIAEVTRTHYMPPWLPEPGRNEFLGERRLSDPQIALIQDWFAAGSPEGNPADVPPAPTYPQGWLLGKPDLVVELPEPYTLAPEGRDLYRNFVIPAPLKEPRFIRAFEFQPRNRSVHHVRIQLDPTGQSRRLDAGDPEPGFPGMKTPAKFPPGHMLTWIPGKSVAPEPEGLAWQLGAGVDLVLQIHFQRTGKPERIQPAIALYFTDQPPTKTSFVLGLGSQLIDIPAGQSNHVEQRTLQLPADVDVIGVLPHLHFLGREVLGFATLPNGQQQPLITIKNWDFNWQDQYRYKNPLFLPKGSVITMRYTFDNSSANPHNPHQPPRRVTYGPQSTDEMAELWLQLIPRDPRDLPAIRKVHQNAYDLETVAYYESQLRANPNDAAVHLALGKVLGPMNRLEEAIREFQTAIQLQPNLAEAHYYFGLSLYTIREWNDALASFETVLKIDPKYAKAHTGLGMVYHRLNQLEKAESEFKRALELNPDDADARQNLQRLQPR